ncbi:MAG: DUF1697 domain-containing protein [Jiangellaceae bacterium]|nr:DUF1697 domain-containing protein [Jiangellaceae bacterium]
MTRYVALLRGINLGARNRVPMRRLRELLEDLGCTDVSTYLQSGNAVLNSPKRSADELSRDIEARIHADLAVDIRVLVFTARTLTAMVAANPLETPGRDPVKLHAAFLSEQPAADRLRSITSTDFGGEEVAVGKKVIYLWLPNGYGRAKLPAELTDKKLGVAVTVRNWRTVTALEQLARS